MSSAGPISPTGSRAAPTAPPAHGDNDAPPRSKRPRLSRPRTPSATGAARAVAPTPEVPGTAQLHAVTALDYAHLPSLTFTPRDLQESAQIIAAYQEHAHTLGDTHFFVVRSATDLYGTRRDGLQRVVANGGVACILWESIPHHRVLLNGLLDPKGPWISRDATRKPQFIGLAPQSARTQAGAEHSRGRLVPPRDTPLEIRKLREALGLPPTREAFSYTETPRDGSVSVALFGE